jgi:hypothetical protein
MLVAARLKRHVHDVNFPIRMKNQRFDDVEVESVALLNLTLSVL